LSLLINMRHPTKQKRRSVTVKEHDLLSRQVVARRLGICVRTLERWAKRGIGPRPIRVGPRLVRYNPSEVDDWLSTDTPPGDH